MERGWSTRIGRCDSRFRKPMLSSQPQSSQFAAALLGATLLAACGDDSRSRDAAAISALRANTAYDVGALPIDSAIVWHQAFELQENVEVTTVSPSVATDPTGGFLVADLREGQIRVYRRDGSLIGFRDSATGLTRRYSFPVSFTRASDNTLVVAEFAGHVFFLDSTAAHLTESAVLPLEPVYGATPLSDSTVLILGRSEQRDRLLHVWDRSKGAVVHSFFPIPRNPRDDTAGVASKIAGWADAEVRGDTIAAVFSLADTLYLFDPSGQLRQKIRIPVPAFRSPRSLPPPRASADYVRAWVDAFTRISDLFWLPDGTFIFQYADTRDDESIWHLVGMRRDGTFLFRADDTPRLWAVRDSVLFFQQGSPSSGANQWQTATLR